MGGPPIRPHESLTNHTISNHVQGSSYGNKTNTSLLAEMKTFLMFKGSKPDFVAYDLESVRRFFGAIDLEVSDADPMDIARTLREWPLIWLARSHVVKLLSRI